MLAGQLPGPMQAEGGACFVGGSDSDKVLCVYIKTTQDRVLKLEQQDDNTGSSSEARATRCYDQKMASIQSLHFGQWS